MTTRTNVSVAAGWTVIATASRTGLKAQNKGPFLVEVIKASAKPDDYRTNIGEVLSVNAAMTTLADTGSGEKWYGRIVELVAPSNHRSIVIVEHA